MIHGLLYYIILHNASQYIEHYTRVYCIMHYTIHYTILQTAVQPTTHYTTEYYNLHYNKQSTDLCRALMLLIRCKVSAGQP